MESPCYDGNIVIREVQYNAYGSDLDLTPSLLKTKCNDSPIKMVECTRTEHF